MTAASRELLRAFPCADWRARRLENFEHARSRLHDPLSEVGIQLLTPEPDAGAFALFLQFPSAERRSIARQELIRRSIYPVVLWNLEQPLVQVSETDVQLSQELLSLHCDYRYDEAHMHRLVDQVIDAVGA